jgi:4,5-epoxidase
MNTSVLIAGAGPTGLALAVSLRLSGVDVRVVDRAPGPAVTSRANFVHARGSEVLERIGALGDLPERSVRAMKITTYLGDRPVMKVKFGDPAMGTAAPPMVISQAAVEAALRARLAELGGAIDWGAGLVGLEQDAEAVTAELGTGETVTAQWLVGCDGTGSMTRKLAGITAAGVRLSERFLLADLQLETDLDRSGTSGWIHPDGMLGLMPMPDRNDQHAGRSWRVIAYDPGRGAERLSQDQLLARVTDILPSRTGDSATKIIEADWLSEFVIHRRLADSYRSGRVLLAGDAAHAHAPFGGQGMLTGLGDAENLGWKLALVIKGLAGDRLLDSYQAERRPLAEDVLRATTAVTKIDVAEHPVGRFIRDHLLVRLFGLPWIQRRTTYTASQLWVSYRGGPLARAGRFGGSPRPGDRVGNSEAVRTDGSATRLHDELGGHWALLTAQAQDTMIDIATDRLPGLVTTLRRTDAVDQTWLIRPDGHLAWRGDDPRGLAHWLDVALGTRRRVAERVDQ